MAALGSPPVAGSRVPCSFPAVADRGVPGKQPAYKKKGRFRPSRSKVKLSLEPSLAVKVPR